MPEKREEFCYAYKGDCQSDCPGGEAKFVPDNYGGEGYYAQTCPFVGEVATGRTSVIEFCGAGPNVLVFFQLELPTDEEVLQRAKDECV